MSLLGEIGAQWGAKPPSIVASLPGEPGMTGTTLGIAFSEFCQDPSGDKFWDFISADPDNTTLSGLEYISRRGVRLQARIELVGLTRAEYQRLELIYNRANHLVNRGATITLKLHQDDDLDFSVRFKRPPKPIQYGIGYGVIIEFEGTELLEDEPLSLIDYGAPV